MALAEILGVVFFSKYDKIIYKIERSDTKVIIELEENTRLINNLQQKLKEIGESL